MAVVILNCYCCCLLNLFDFVIDAQIQYIFILCIFFWFYFQNPFEIGASLVDIVVGSERLLFIFFFLAFPYMFFKFIFLFCYIHFTRNKKTWILRREKKIKIRQKGTKNTQKIQFFKFSVSVFFFFLLHFFSLLVLDFVII